MEVIMNKDEIKECLIFLHQYVDDMKSYDEHTVQMISGSNKSKSEIIDYFLESIKDYEALLG